MSLFQSVRSIMTHDVERVDLDTPVSTVRRTLRARPYHHMPVVRGELLVGIVSLVDIYRISLENYVQDDETVDAWLDSTYTLDEVMSHEPAAVRSDMSIREAAEKLAGGDFHALPVVDDNGHLQGILTTTDLIRTLLAVG